MRRSISDDCFKWFVDRGLYPQPANGDGNCLFNSLVQLMRGCPQYDQKLTQQFREHVVETMAERIKTDTNLRNALSTLNVTPQQYLKRMKKDGTWGGYIEIVVVACILNCRIYIYDYTQWNAKEKNWEIIYSFPEYGDREVEYHLLRIHNNHYEPIFLTQVLQTYYRGQNQLCKPPTTTTRPTTTKRPTRTRKTVHFSSSVKSVQPTKNKDDLLPGILFMVVTIGLGIGLGFGLTK